MNKDYRATIIANMARHMTGLDFATIASRVVGMLILQKGNLGRYQSVLETAFEAHAMALRPTPPTLREHPLDWSTFAGPTRNVEWKPDDQDLIYTALNYRNDEYGDKDDDAGQQIVERLLSAWQQAELAAGKVNAHRHELLEQASAPPPRTPIRAYLLEATCFLLPGRKKSLHAGIASLNEEAAKFTNIIRKEVGLEDDATPEDWQAKCLQARYARAEMTGRRVDDLDGGHVWFTEMDFEPPAYAAAIPSPQTQKRGQFLPTEDGEFNGNEAPEPGSTGLDADKIAKAIVLAACELDDTPNPDDDDTILITVQDLEAVAHRHITVALDRAALTSEGSAE
ncbi:Hypothetical protein NGAL_HAMBI1146_59940 [Neorhizobium galegae bv. officinalis]|nr:Hypothetical protein NGAL_HAMBI1146_59940 [Neorhizobium galegae bv. officinalis]